MTKLKVLTVVGTRPEIIRLSRVMARLDEYCDHRLVHTGQNYDYELKQIFFDDLGVRKPDHFLEAAGGSAAETIGRIIIAVDRVLSDERPEALLVLGDTNSCLAVIPAKRRRIPVFHMEAGNRCFDQRVPEEINRRIVDHTADVNLCYSAIARDYLLREGLPPDLVITTGSPMFEVLEHYRPRIEGSDVLGRLEVAKGGYFVVSAHREENIDTPRAFHRLVGVLNAVAMDFGLPVLVSTHPRTRRRIDAEGVIHLRGRIDDMVKINGKLVEPAEAERVLRSIPGVVNVVVLPRRLPSGHHQLVAHVEADPAVSDSDLRTALHRELPAHLVPGLFVRHGALPLTDRGKVDREALSTALPPRRFGVAAGQDDDRLVEAELSIARLVLEIGDIGADESLFDLGMDSLGAIEFVVLVNEAGEGYLEANDLVAANT